MNTILGMNIVISKGYPKVQCSEEFKRLQSPELVASTNQWMASFFGYTSLIHDGDVMHDEVNNILLMNQNTFDKIQKNQKDLFFPHSIQKR